MSQELSQEFAEDKVDFVVGQLTFWHIPHEVQWNGWTKATIKVNIPKRGRKRFLVRNARLLRLCGFSEQHLSITTT